MLAELSLVFGNNSVVLCSLFSAKRLPPVFRYAFADMFLERLLCWVVGGIVRNQAQRDLFGEVDSELNLVFSMLSTSVTRPSWTVICTEPKRRFSILLNTTSIHSLLEAEVSFCSEFVVGVDMMLTGYFSGVERAICERLARNPSAGSALRF